MFLMGDTHWLRRAVGILLHGLVAVAASCANQVPPPTAAVPVEPIAAIVEAFATHDVVALGEGSHGSNQGHTFRLSLLRDARFAATVNDIVVEFGSSLYQDVMDRFVRNGNVACAELRQVWENTTQAHAPWDKSIYEEFFRAVRSLNASRPPEHQVRILLGEPPIDWRAVRTGADANVWLDQRESYPAELIRREVLAKGRRALVIYGDGHFFRRTPYGSIVTLLEERPAARVFTIATVTDADMAVRHAGVATWPRPSLSMLRGSDIGMTDVAVLLPAYRQDWLKHMEDHFDAVLYLGPPSAITWSRFSRALCADADYMKMRLHRLALFPGLAAEIGRLKRDCGVTQPSTLSGNSEPLW